MKITDAFLGEHAVFYAQFNHLETAISQAECTGRIKVLSAMLASALATHAHLEDELLFVHLEPHMGTQSGPLAVMRQEHTEIETSLERLPACDDIHQAKNLFLHVIDVARQHFAKEEQILYPMALQILDEKTLIQLGDEWAKQRSVSIQTQGAPICHHG